MHASRADLPAQVLGDYEGRFVDWGETRVAIETMPANFPPDESPFEGLPDDRCQCPHWGYVDEGLLHGHLPRRLTGARQRGRRLSPAPRPFRPDARADRGDRVQPGPRARQDDGRGHGQRLRGDRVMIATMTGYSRSPSRSCRPCGTALPSSSGPDSTSRRSGPTSWTCRPTTRPRPTTSPGPARRSSTSPCAARARWTSATRRTPLDADHLVRVDAGHRPRALIRPGGAARAVRRRRAGRRLRGRRSGARPAEAPQAASSWSRPARLAA